MKRVVRIVWISALSGLAFLSACLSSRGLTRAERKKLIQERDSIERSIANLPPVDTLYPVREEYYFLMNRLDSIDFRLGKDVDLAKNIRSRELQSRMDVLYRTKHQVEYARVYGSPEMMEGYYRSQAAYLQELEDSIQIIQKELRLLENTNMESEPRH